MAAPAGFLAEKNRRREASRSAAMVSGSERESWLGESGSRGGSSSLLFSATIIVELGLGGTWERRGEFGVRGSSSSS